MNETTDTNPPDSPGGEAHDEIVDAGAPELASMELGDGSFTAFYRDHWPELSRALVLALGDEQLGVDAAAEGFSRACERWGSVSQLGNPQGWVYRVSLNWARSWLRRRQTERRRQERVRDGSVDQLPDPDLERAMTALSPQHRDVVILRFFLDLSVIETADALGVAPGTVKSRLSRALETLHYQLGGTQEIDIA